MSFGDKLTLAGVVVGVLAIAAAWWVGRRYGTRRRKLLFLFEATSLVPEIKGYAGSGLKVTFHDVAVEEPHLLTIRLTNVGPADVASSHFDAGKPVQVLLNSTLYGVLNATHGERTITPALGAENAIVELAPVLLKRKDTWVVEVLVSGAPAPELVSSLVDTDVVTQTVADRLARATERALPVFIDAGGGALVPPPLIGSAIKLLATSRTNRRKR